MTRRSLWAPLVIVALLGLSSPLTAQSAAQRLTSQARAQIDDINADSARTLLIAALNVSTTPAERVRAFTLLGIAELNRKNASAARDAFVRALSIDGTTRIDTLAFLDNEAPAVFATARQIAQAAALERPELVASLHLTLSVPADTQISPDDARLPIVVQPTLNARVFATITAVGRTGEILWNDSAATGGRRVFTWPLRTQSGALWPEGRYLLRAQAIDSTGQATPFQERQLRITRFGVDTQPIPRPPPASAFAPESIKVGSASARTVVFGGALAAMVAVMPMLGNPTLNKSLAGDPTAYAIAGGVAVTSVARFIMGRARTQVVPANVLRNQQVIAAYQRQRDDVIRTNGEARARAQMRVIVERSQ